MVEKAWSTPCSFTKSIDKWQFKVRTLRRIIRGWAANEVVDLNKTKANLLDKFSKLESLYEVRDLTLEESEEYTFLESKLEQIWALEDIKVRQKNLGKGTF